jgi:hypothetical protein
MNHINKNKAGLTLGTTIGGLHLVWSLLIAIGLAQPLVDFVLKIHMVKPMYIVDSFNAGSALLLIVITAIIGYIVGYTFASIWNKINN